MTAIVFNGGSSDALMSRVQAAYLAGFIDGEGCLTIGRARRSSKDSRAGFSYEALLTIGNTNLEALRALLVMCRNGKIQLSDKRTTLGHKPMYRIVFSANQIRHVLPQIRPYLLIKRKQADILTKFLASKIAGQNVTPEKWQRWERWRAEIRALNLRGIKDVAPETLTVRPRAELPRGACSIDGCKEQHYGRGFCYPHYYANVITARREQRKKQAVAQVCAVCGKEFESKRIAQCCSKKCGDRRHYQLNAEKIKAQVAAARERRKHAPS